VPKEKKAGVEQSEERKVEEQRSKPGDDDLQIGQPSTQFIRKIFNLMTYKQEKLTAIKYIEEKLSRRFKGDYSIPLGLAAEGKYEYITKEQYDLISQKELIKQSFEEYLSIFNIYKQFHRKKEPVAVEVPVVVEEAPKEPEGCSEEQLRLIATMMAVSQNVQVIGMCIQSIHQSQQAQMLSQGATMAANINQIPSHIEIQKVIKFFNYTSLLGSFSLGEAEAGSNQPLGQPQRNMTLEEKVEHIRSELANLVQDDNKSVILNSLFKYEGNYCITFQEVRDILVKI
jgi:hypothetical protein